MKKECGFSIFENVKCANKYFIAKYKIIQSKKEFAINIIPLLAEVPKIASKFLSFKISELIKVKESNNEYRLLSIELNKVSKI